MTYYYRPCDFCGATPGTAGMQHNPGCPMTHWLSTPTVQPTPLDMSGASQTVPHESFYLGRIADALERIADALHEMNERTEADAAREESRQRRQWDNPL